MKAKSLIFSAAIAATLCQLTACSDDFFGSNVGKPVQFATNAGRHLRTMYGGAGHEWNIYWKQNDQIRIYSWGFTPDNAAYTITQGGNGVTQSKISPVDENNMLRWPDEDTHRFWATYPADKDKINIEFEEGTGIHTVTYKMITEQTGIHRGSNVYDVNMDYVYLLGWSDYIKSSQMTDGYVLLTLYPQSLVFDVTLQGFINSTATEDREIESVTFKTQCQYEKNGKDLITLYYGAPLFGTPYNDVIYTWRPDNTLTIPASNTSTANTAQFTISMMLTHDVSSTYPMTITINCAGGKKYVATLRNDPAISHNDKIKLVLPPFSEDTPFGDDKKLDTFTLKLDGSAMQHTVSQNLHETGDINTDNFVTNGWEE